jgi:GDP-4-dehydro-6-deoxy-D-mannose reductase
MKFLVTGATGFTGPHMINRILEDGHEVVAMVRNLKSAPDIVDTLGEDNIKKVDFVYGDLAKPESIEPIFLLHRFDGVFHLGAMAHPPTAFEYPLLTSQINFMGSAKIVDEIINKMPQCVLLHCSTPAVYGTCPVDRNLKEDTPMKPNIPYGVSKAAADLYVLERAANAGLKCFLTRAFSQAGPRRGENFCISSDAAQIARILLGRQEPIIKIGNMKSQRTIADVRDVVNAYFCLMLAHFEGKVPNGDIFHIAGNTLHEMQYYLDIMLEITNLNETVKLEIEPKYFRKNDNAAQIPDDSKIRDLIGWEPNIPIKQTMQDLVDYWLNRLTKENKNGN